MALGRGDRPNILVILSDEHAAGHSGFAGHPTVQTPHLDALSRDGTTFEQAYCTSPMCVPSRLSMLSGHYVHEVGAWDNEVVPPADLRTWADHLRPAGYESVLIGRTHFNGDDRLHGFDQRPVDDLPQWLSTSGRPASRRPGWQRGSNSHVSEVRVGDHPHTRADRAATRAAIDYLSRRPAGGRSASPFLLYVGYMHPHFPFVVPPEYARRYRPADVVLPYGWDARPQDQHPVIAQLRHSFRNDEPLLESQHRAATAAYWSLISHVDDQIGRLLSALDRAGLTGNTVVIYTSDHGEMAGAHGIWQKQCFYEPAVRVPMIIKQPGRAARRISTPVSTIDLLPTLRDCAGLDADPELAGRSLLTQEPDERPVFAEYHAQGMITGGFMIRSGRYKLCAYADRAPQLFDLAVDPDEADDRSDDPGYAAIRTRLSAELARFVDVDSVDRQARADQRRRSAS